MKQRFINHEDIPVWLVDYILTVADAGRITDISLDDINDFLQGLEDYYKNSLGQEVLNRQLIILDD